MARTNPTTACLVNVYMGSPAKATIPASDDVATSAPPPRATSSGTSARVPKTMPSTLTERIRRYCSSVTLVMSSSPVVTPAFR